MFLIDKYYNELNNLSYYDLLINKIINYFDSYNYIYNNFDTIINLSNNEFKNIILEKNHFRYVNFQHLIVYGVNGTCKEYIINKLLEKIYGKHGIEVKDIEYVISGYSNTKTKILIKQSKYHIIIEPNTNSFDKYLIQEIIHEYAKSELLNILKYNKLFKIIIINKIDNLSYYIQSALRRTMEKYSNICKFILISNQLSKVIEPLRSRCLLIRIPLATNLQILESILYISYKENYSLTSNQISTIINKSDNIINKTIWLFDLYKYNITYNNNWNDVIDNIINLLCKPMIHNKDLLLILKKLEKIFIYYL